MACPTYTTTNLLFVGQSWQKNGDCILVQTFDTSGHPHDAEYLADLAIKSIKTSESLFGVKVKSFVKDNASNVKKMRKVKKKI